MTNLIPDEENWDDHEAALEAAKDVAEGNYYDVEPDELVDKYED